MSAHDTISTPNPDNISTPVSGLTATITLPASEQRGYGEPHTPTKRRIGEEVITDLGDGYAVRQSGEHFNIISPGNSQVFPLIIFRRLIAYHVPLVAGGD